MAKAPPDLPTTHEDPGSRRTVLLGKGGSGAVTRPSHLRSHTRKAHALRPAHLCSASWSWARGARRHLGTRDSFRGAPPRPRPRPAIPSISRAGVVQSLPRLPTGPHPSPSFPPPVCRGTGIRSHQPGAGEAAKGGGGGSKG